jgi:hypothetical protein
MIKTFIKHFIYENCIEVLFNALTRNFRQPLNILKYDDRGLKRGDKFFFIVVIEETLGETYNITYHNPTVVEVSDGTDWVLFGLPRTPSITIKGMNYTYHYSDGHEEKIFNYYDDTILIQNIVSWIK